jgi:hypothetical protein
MNKNLSAVSIRRLRKVANAILTDYKLYDQHSPNTPVKNSGLTCTFSDACGTPGCLLGWANKLFRKPTKAEIRKFSKLALPQIMPADVQVCFREGAIRLRLSVKQADRLWLLSNWPMSFREQYGNSNRHSRARARVASQRITHFIETDGAE